MQTSSTTGDHQDWTPVILSGKKPVKQPGSGPSYDIQNKMNDEERAKAAKQRALENESETFKIETVPMSIAQEMMKGRNAMKMTQKELAQKLNLQPAVIASYESGKAIPDPQILQKISKVLGVRLSLKQAKSASAPTKSA